MGYSVELTQFTSRDAEELCRVSMDQQRNWRRYGFLPPIQGHARLDVFDLCELYSLGLLTEKGIAPKQAVEVVDIMRMGLAWHALTCAAAYDGEDHLLSNEPLNELEKRLDNPIYGRLNRYGRAAFKGKEGLMGKGRLIPARFFIWFADGTHTWDQGVDHHFHGNEEDLRVAGPVIVLDQMAVGLDLAHRSNKPFALVMEADD
ncbi:MAG: hypothetical protein AAGK00_18280 [Pseudomonadota bacterium]